MVNNINRYEKKNFKNFGCSIKIMGTPRFFLPNFLYNIPLGIISDLPSKSYLENVL